jgi:hypothetical protein
MARLLRVIVVPGSPSSLVLCPAIVLFLVGAGITFGMLSILQVCEAGKKFDNQ